MNKNNGEDMNQQNKYTDEFSEASLKQKLIDLDNQIAQLSRYHKRFYLSNLLLLLVDTPVLVSTIVTAHSDDLEKLPSHIVFLAISAIIMMINLHTNNKIKDRILEAWVEKLKTKTMLQSPTAIEIYKNVIYKDKQK